MTKATICRIWVGLNRDGLLTADSLGVGKRHAARGQPEVDRAGTESLEVRGDRGPCGLGPVAARAVLLEEDPARCDVGSRRQGVRDRRPRRPGRHPVPDVGIRGGRLGTGRTGRLRVIGQRLRRLSDLRGPAHALVEVRDEVRGCLADRLVVPAWPGTGRRSRNCSSRPRPVA